MDLKVNHNDINAFYDVSNMQSELLQDNIKVWLEKLDELKEIWQGQDADAFFENCSSYINRLKIIPKCYDSLDSFILKANRTYHETDEEGKKRIEREMANLKGGVLDDKSNN